VVLALGAVAVGSFLYHGPQPAWADAAHDASIALLLGALASRGGAHGSMRDRRRATVVVVVLAAALLVVAVPRSVAAVHGALAGLVAVMRSGRCVARGAGRRRGSRSSPSSPASSSSRSGAPAGRCASRVRSSNRTPGGTSRRRSPRQRS
jgi:hypothetical protein